MPARNQFTVEPLYLQVRNLLARRLVQGVWKPGTALPNEQDLARELGVSVGTVRKALDQLEEDHLIVRRQGRGTFAVDQASGELAIRFSNIRDREGRRIAGRMQVLAKDAGPATAVEQERLQLAPSEPVLRIKRVRHFENRPYMAEEVALAASRFPGLGEEEAGAEDLPITALAQRHGVMLARGLERVSLAEASRETASLLNVEPGTALLCLDRVIFDREEVPLEWRVGLCHLPEGAIYVGETH